MNVWGRISSCVCEIFRLSCTVCSYRIINHFTCYIHDFLIQLQKASKQKKNTDNNNTIIRRLAPLVPSTLTQRWYYYHDADTCRNVMTRAQRVCTLGWDPSGESRDINETTGLSVCVAVFCWWTNFSCMHFVMNVLFSPSSLWNNEHLEPLGSC